MNGLTALADPTRQQIVKMLAKGALSSGDIARRFDMTPPAVSQHLKTLREAKLVTVRAVAQKRFYELDPAGIGEVAAFVDELRRFWAGKFDALEAELKK
ncbi:MAG: winged helix-turn-helix transcriptional regulator [Proteobacteria bacterium]|nr:winged helix-turn-helix transcriptional regulator [Pseudomonadota bacterium]